MRSGIGKHVLTQISVHFRWEVKGPAIERPNSFLKMQLRVKSQKSKVIRCAHHIQLQPEDIALQGSFIPTFSTKIVLFCCQFQVPNSNISYLIMMSISKNNVSICCRYCNKYPIICSNAHIRMFGWLDVWMVGIHSEDVLLQSIYRATHIQVVQKWESCFYLFSFLIFCCFR